MIKNQFHAMGSCDVLTFNGKMIGNSLLAKIAKRYIGQENLPIQLLNSLKKDIGKSLPKPKLPLDLGFHHVEQMELPYNKFRNDIYYERVLSNNRYQITLWKEEDHGGELFVDCNPSYYRISVIDTVTKSQGSYSSLRFVGRKVKSVHAKSSKIYIETDDDMVAICLW